MSPPRRKIRCAIYCRKSSEEGLDQTFNSLDAQREACLSYIESQRHEGWMAVDDRYDDGGFSGGTLDRPGLRRLLRDMEGGRLDVIVTYKLDRLSRSLTDFVKLIELFDKHDVTFVSITQQFCTTTSMGRLTLNILLSFAQFERELASERIRDKFLAVAQARAVDGRPRPFGLRCPGSKARGQRHRGEPRQPHFPALPAGGLGHQAGAGAERRRTPHQARQAVRQRRPVQAAQQPHLRRRGRAQGYRLPRRARGHRRPRHLGQGAHDPGRERAPARQSDARGHPGVCSKA